MLRRQFIGLGLGAAGAAVLGTFYYRRHPNPSSPPFAKDGQHSSAWGRLDTSIDVTSGLTTFDGQSRQVYSYGGRLPGPAITVKPGDSVQIQLNNHLPEPTNLHFHGLHIPPTGRADNIFLEVPEGESMRYNFSVPKNHPAGLFWCHPHLHGHSAKQVSMGLAAPFIVRGELDQVPEVAAAEEHILVLQDLPPSEHGMMHSEMHGRRRGSPSILINGQIGPAISIAQNGLVRLRFLNASGSRYFRIKIEEHPLYIIAADGGGISVPQVVEEVTLMPGQRTDVLVRGERPSGTYKILNLRSDAAMSGEEEEACCSGSEPIASLEYGAPSKQIWNVPTRLIHVEALPSPGASPRSFVLGGGGMMEHGGSYSINGQRFRADRIDTTVRVGTIEDWEYENHTGMDHPMHLHVNSFQILDEAGEPELAWRDLVNVPAHGSARIRVQFKDFEGTTVQHCHILDHEDRGMMATVSMLKNG